MSSLTLFAKISIKQEINLFPSTRTLQVWIKQTHTTIDLQKRGGTAQSAPLFGDKHKPQPGTLTSNIPSEKHLQEDNPAVCSGFSSQPPALWFMVVVVERQEQTEVWGVTGQHLHSSSQWEIKDSAG